MATLDRQRDGRPTAPLPQRRVCLYPQAPDPLPGGRPHRGVPGPRMPLPRLRPVGAPRYTWGVSTVEQLALIRRSLADVVSELNALVQDVQDVQPWDEPAKAELRRTT